ARDDSVAAADSGDDPNDPTADPERVRAELARVEAFIARAQALPGDGKARALIQAVRLVLDRARAGAGAGKVVLFTESLTTQDYLRELLLESGAVSDEVITLFRGTNDSPRAAQALERWEREVGAELPAQPSRDVAVRLALVHEFATRSKVFISTEAGA